MGWAARCFFGEEKRRRGGRREEAGRRWERKGEQKLRAGKSSSEPAVTIKIGTVH